MIHIFDGAMGTILQQQGLLPSGYCPELLCIDNPGALTAIHKKYVDAGATIIETNTFGASPIKLSHYNLENKTREINIAAVKAAKVAAKNKARVAGSMGPTGKFIKPLGDLDFEDAYENYKLQAAALYEAGADYIIIETSIDLQEMRAALLAAKDVTTLPVICQLSYSEDGRTVTGTDPQTAAITLDRMGADIIGVNCSLGPEQLVPIVKMLSENTEKPISVQPNAGLPQLINGKTTFPMGPEDFGKWAPHLVQAGATYIGGCCGTTPAHIAALKESLKDCKEPEFKPLRRRLMLTSRSKTVTIDKELPTVLIGERINPTGRKKLAAEIKEGSFLSVKKEAIDQVKVGAQLLDINMGVGGINQAQAMKKAITEISQLTDAPLIIDTSDPEVLEAGLRAYPGRALINSVSAEKERLRTFIPLAKKYGAAILCLPLTDEGIPKTAADRISVMDTILDAAKKAGLRDGDFLLDALVMTIAADQYACNHVLDTLKMYRTKYGYPSTMGLSNISFGLPNRPLMNSTFFSMCLAEGLDAPIMNPYDDQMQNALLASMALLGKDPNGIAYSKNENNLTAPKKAAIAKHTQLSPVDAVKQAIIDGDTDAIPELIENALKDNIDPTELTEKALTAAMNDIGVDFGAGRIFLPQVLLSAEAMKNAFDVLKVKYPAKENNEKGTVVLATVKGDIHDLGKNIVGALLENSGFKLIDLGKDVPAEEIVAAAIKNDADIVGLCALMTTTMTEIDEVIRQLNKAGSPSKTMVGGAALTQDYADEAGADYYAKDAVIALNIANEIIKK
ncbi:MAG: homocysteine S-methyltransferase family protein [Anaerovibrio sp.]|uniref:homocysteine S-methyltransferase family protein n=1 Tax=Anaerovibrio sp. TaxID=1872532 RepID=UPI0025EFE9BE|nr:homocysteine S-methyltransferase family protein [Anaerovibrio sp.]MCR5177135.1 homocysteine S-methyltransferase family protein [Anaerovibrio sp.]